MTQIYFNLISNSGKQKIGIDTTLLITVSSKSYTYTGNCFIDIAVQVLGTFLATNRDTVLEIPDSENNVKVRLNVFRCDNSINIALKNSDDTLIVLNTLQFYDNNVGLLRGIKLLIAEMIEEAIRM